MGLFGRKLIEAIAWTDTPGLLAERWPTGGAAIRHGAMLTVREGQHALLLAEGVVADQFGPGAWPLDTGNLPRLAALLAGDFSGDGGFLTDVIFLSMRRQLDRRWGTPQPVSVRDADFGTLRLRAFGRYAYQISDPLRFLERVLGSLDRFTSDDLEPQLRAGIAARLASRLGGGGIAFLDMAAAQAQLSADLAADVAPLFAELGLALSDFHIESLSVPEAVQAAIDGKAAASGAPADTGDILATIERLHALWQAGALTEAEFTARKTALLARLA